MWELLLLKSHPDVHGLLRLPSGRRDETRKSRREKLGISVWTDLLYEVLGRLNKGLLLWVTLCCFRC